MITDLSLHFDEIPPPARLCHIVLKIMIYKNNKASLGSSCRTRKTSSCNHPIHFISYYYIIVYVCWRWQSQWLVFYQWQHVTREIWIICPFQNLHWLGYVALNWNCHWYYQQSQTSWKICIWKWDCRACIHVLPVWCVWEGLNSR
jgi:hypothetical protein